MSETTTTKVTIARCYDTRNEVFHVHAAGCADLSKGRKYVPAESFTIEVSSIADVVADVYPPDEFDYDDTDADQVACYAGDFKFLPCCGDLR